MWKSSDKCQFYECSANILAENITEAKIVSYRKSCAVLKDCPPKQVITKDCCMHCASDQQPTNQSEWDDFVHWSDKYDEQMSKETYLQHPCRRECIVGATPKVCEYTFVVCISAQILRLKTILCFKEPVKISIILTFWIFSIFFKFLQFSRWSGMRHWVRLASSVLSTPLTVIGHTAFMQMVHLEVF